MSNFDFDLGEIKRKISHKRKKKNKSELMEVDVLTKGEKRSLFVDLPKDIELKISDSTIDQQVQQFLKKKFKYILCFYF